MAHQINGCAVLGKFSVPESSLRLKLPFISGACYIFCGVFWLFGEFIESILGSAFKDAFFCTPSGLFLILAVYILWSKYMR